jgi:hypothetical protein
MAVTDSNEYGSYAESRPAYINEYGVATDKYGVVTDPANYSILLTELGGHILQEDGSNLLMG